METNNKMETLKMQMECIAKKSQKHQSQKQPYQKHQTYTPKMEFSSYMMARFEALNLLWERKNSEYANEKAPFKAFSDMASRFSFHNTPQQVLWELMAKHLNSVKNYCSGDELNTVKLREKTGDIILYLMILEGIANEMDKKVTYNLSDNDNN